ncbi:MAG TPA: hypothetical protein PLV64_11470 [Anaerolineales bacterium]|nr:hypothetical protein [Anaerolineales bacterium]
MLKLGPIQISWIQDGAEEIQKSKNAINERLKAEIEWNKFRLDRRKLAFEWLKYRNDRWQWLTTFLTPIGTFLAVFIPLFVAALAYKSSVSSEQMQTLRASELAKNEFKLKVIETAFNTDNPEAAKNKIILLKALFPEDLNKVSVEQIDTSKIAQPNPEIVLELIQVVAEHPDQREILLSLYDRLIRGVSEAEANAIEKDQTNDPFPQLPKVPCTKGYISMCTFQELIEIYNIDPQAILMDEEFIAFIKNNRGFINFIYEIAEFQQQYEIPTSDADTNNLPLPVGTPTLP